MKSLLGSPVIVDTDGRVRWVVPAAQTSAVLYGNGQFMTGSETTPTVTVLQFDGSQSTPQTNLSQPLLQSFTHNIDPGLLGALAEFSGTDSLGSSELDIVAEFRPLSTNPPIQTFDMAEILASYMTVNGDTASEFVRPGTDWFHVNASTYDRSDNTVIVSSRENFLIKLNYLTHEIVWIFGDPTKYSYNVSVSESQSTHVKCGWDYPIGQHATSITADGYLMVFNDGFASTNTPPGASAGVMRTFSEVSGYSVNTAKMTAQNVWNFNYGNTIFSPICGSSYEQGNSYLVDFATADNFLHARLVGLDANPERLMLHFQYPSPSYCGAAWNAIPIPMESLQIN